MSPGSETAWDALDKGEWEDAFRSFDRLVQASDADAAVWEGFGWAAWWKNDVTMLLQARERAYHLYREAEDRAAAARMAIWLGCDHHDFCGEHAVANGWHLRARRLLADLPTTPEHGWLAFQEGAYALELEEDTLAAKASAEATAQVGRELGLPDFEFLGLALEGLALVTEGAIDAGMRCLDEAGVAVTAGEYQQRIATTWTLCYLIYGCERVRDFGRAAEWCGKMRQLSTKVGFELGVGVCRAHYGGLLVLHGDWEGAERELLEATATLTRVRPPAAMESEARLGELRRRQDRSAEAASLFERSAPHPLAVLGTARLALDEGDPTRAAEIVQDVLDMLPTKSVTQRADALELMARARADLGETGAARAAADALGEIARAVGTKPVQAMAAAADGFVAVAEDDLAQGRRRLDAAVTLYERSGLPYEAADVRLVLAALLRRIGRADAAEKQTSLAVGRLRALGASATADRAAGLTAAGPDDTDGSDRQLGLLSPREMEVLTLLVDGSSDREIAARLTISPHTVHRHVSNILAKLTLPSRTAAAAYAARHGIGRDHDPAR